MATVPGIPTGVSATAKDGHVVVLWTAPASGGSPILDYLITYGTQADGFGTTYSAINVAPNTGKSIVDLPGGTKFYFSVLARNAIGTGTDSARVSATTLARTSLSSVASAAVDVPGGVRAEIRSNAANTPTLTLGYIPIGGSWTPIGVVPTDESPTSFAASGLEHDLALVADDDGNLYVIGRVTGSRGRLLVRRYARTGATTWTASGVLAGNLTATLDPLLQFAGAFVPGTGPTPKSSILVVTRRAGSTKSGLSYAALDVAAIAASSGNLLLSSGDEPTFLPTPVGGPVNSTILDVAFMGGMESTQVNGSYRVAIVANGSAVVNVVNGVVSGQGKTASGAVSSGTRARVVGIDAGRYALLTINSTGDLVVSIRDLYAVEVRSTMLAAVNVAGGAYASQWDAYYDARTDQVVVVRVSASDPRKLERTAVSVDANSTSTTVLTSTFGPASSTTDRLRIVHGLADERRVIVQGDNLSAGTRTLQEYTDTSGNVAPSAPFLSAVSGLNATAANTFGWTFGDANHADRQSAYQIQIARVSDSVLVVSPAKTTSTTSSHTVAAGTLVNGTAYKWRVMTWDGLDVASPWAAYSTFTPSTAGVLTITAPAADNPAGLDTASTAVTWTYVQAEGYVQASRQIRVVRTSDEIPVQSSGVMAASTSKTYTVGPLSSGVEYRVEVTIQSNGPGTTVTASRLLTPSYSAPMTPTMTFAAGEHYLDVLIENPAPTGDRPEVTSNAIYRREVGPNLGFVRIAVVPNGGTYRDRAVRAGVSYDYQIAGHSEAAVAFSIIDTAAAPSWSGVWLHDPAAPEATERSFLYGNIGRGEKIDVERTLIRLLGRPRPIAEYGDGEDVVLTLSITVPFDADHSAAIEWFRVRLRARSTLCYRDNRGRLEYVSLGGVGVTDAKIGTLLTTDATVVDFSEEV